MIYFCANNVWISFLFVLNIIIIAQRVLGASLMPNVSQELISKLYSKYKEAVEDDTLISTRRLFTQNRQYKIHVKKLKQVNGFKRHNLMIKEVKREKNPLIYINNPVESKFPNAYLTLEEFKQALINRILTQRETTKQFNLRTPKQLITTRLMSIQHSKMITLVRKNSKEMLSTKLNNYTASKLPQNITITDVTQTKLIVLNSTNILTTNINPNFTTTKNNSVSFKDEEFLITEPFKNNTNEITEVVIINKDNIKTSTITQLKESSEHFLPHNESTTAPDTTTIKMNTDMLHETEIYETGLSKNLEVTKVPTSDGKDKSNNTSPTSFHTEELTQKEKSYEDIMETGGLEDAETSTEMKTETTTRSTRRTLGRPLVFMGGN